MNWRKWPITSPSSQPRSLFSLKEANLGIPNKNFQAVLTRFQVGGFTRPQSLLSACGRVTASLSLDSSSRLFNEFWIPRRVLHMRRAHGTVLTLSPFPWYRTHSGQVRLWATPKCLTIGGGESDNQWKALVILSSTPPCQYRQDFGSKLFFPVAAYFLVLANCFETV